MSFEIVQSHCSLLENSNNELKTSHLKDHIYTLAYGLQRNFEKTFVGYWTYEAKDNPIMRKRQSNQTGWN